MTLFSGWEEIRKYKGVSLSTIMRLRPELIKTKSVFYQLVGRPPKRRVFAHSHILERFFYHRSQSVEGERENA
jgi:hypothetical protein